MNDLDPTKDYPFGECPLSKDGICESENECPYGCDAKVRVWNADEELADDALIQACQAYCLHRFLVISANLQRFKELNSSGIVVMYQQQLEKLQPHITPWVQERFEKHWPEFWPDFKERGIDANYDWSRRLNRLYPDTRIMN